MRIDKFLKVSRLIKEGHWPNKLRIKDELQSMDKVAKASSVVKEGDELAIRFGQKIVTVKINLLKTRRKKTKQRRCTQF